MPPLPPPPPFPKRHQHRYIFHRGKTVSAAAELRSRKRPPPLHGWTLKSDPIRIRTTCLSAIMPAGKMSRRCLESEISTRVHTSVPLVRKKLAYHTTSAHTRIHKQACKDRKLQESCSDRKPYGLSGVLPTSLHRLDGHRAGGLRSTTNAYEKKRFV